ncbi:MAG: DUF1186 domain-containing protein [Xanthobacteraceae bacterium]
MDAAELLHDLSERGRLPVEAISAAEADRASAVAIFLDTIERHLSAGSIEAGPAPDALFLIFHLLGAWRETSAYRPLARLLRLPPDEVNYALGGALTENTHQVMAAVFDGDPSPLYEIVLDERADEFVRSRMCEAVAMAAVHCNLPREEAAGFLRRCYRDLKPQDECFVWQGWQAAIALLGLVELEPLVEQAFSRGLISTSWLEIKHFKADLQRAIYDPAALFGPRCEYSLFGDVIEEFSSWHCYQPMVAGTDFASGWKDYAPAHNPFRRVGRNDPCPCGSGKKFKKCCLTTAAAQPTVLEAGAGSF